MATLPALLTPRDTDILAALDRCPLTVRQLLALSETFARRFGSERRVRQRLQALVESGFARRWQFAAVGQGTLNYYTLSPAGFRMLYGVDEPLPHAATFRPVGIARLAHTQALADFLVYIAVAAHRVGLLLHGYCPENSVQLTAGTESLFPDGAFQLLTPERRAFSFFVEIDNATERLQSDRSLDSWERKLRLYEAYQDGCPSRFRLLVVTTGTGERLSHILALAARLARNPARTLAYGITLDRFRAEPAALTSPCFLDHRIRPVTLVPLSRQHAAPMPPAVRTPRVAVAAPA
jgi:Replication-relaxation